MARLDTRLESEGAEFIVLELYLGSYEKLADSEDLVR